MPSVRGFSTVRARSYVFRLPLFTRAIVVVISIFWILTLPGLWDVQEWGALVPDKVSFTSGKQNVHRHRQCELRLTLARVH